MENKEVFELDQLIKKSSLLRFIYKSVELGLRFWWLLILLAITGAAVSFFLQKQEIAPYETTFLIKSTQLNSDISSFIIDDQFEEVGKQLFGKEGQLLDIKIEDNNANLELLQKLEITSMVYPLELSDWLKFQDYLRIKVISKDPIEEERSSALVKLIESNVYMSSIKRVQERLLKRKLQLLQNEIENEENDRSMSKTEAVDLKLRALELEHALNELSSAELIYQTDSIQTKTYDKKELLLFALAGFLLALIGLHLFVRS